MKIIKSFKQLSEINRRDLYKGGKLKPLNKKFAVSMARQLADGFENVNLQKEPTDYQYRKARKIIDTWFDSVNSGKSKIVRPSKNNRKYYAEFSATPKNFKVYAVPIMTEQDEFKIKKGKLIRSGKHVTTENYNFPNMIKAVKEPAKETNKIIKKIDRDFKGKIHEVHIRTGKHTTNKVYDISLVGEEVEKWTMIYDNFKDFAFGLTVYSFKGQQARKLSNLKLKKKKGK